MIIIGVVVCIKMISNLNLHRLYRVYICNKLFALILSLSVRIAEPEPPTAVLNTAAVEESK